MAEGDAGITEARTVISVINGFMRTRPARCPNCWASISAPNLHS
jgi:hypothetical protein